MENGKKKKKGIGFAQVKLQMSNKHVKLYQCHL